MASLLQKKLKKICDDKGIDVAKIVKDTQPICFENACWAYTVGAAMAIKKGTTKAVEAAKLLVKVYRLSVFQVLLLKTEKLVQVMVILHPCF